MTRLVAVAAPVPSIDALTYRVPDGLPMPVVGARVLVPLGARTLTACVLSTSVEPPVGQIRDVIEVLDEEAFLPPDVVDLATWMADYYVCGVGEAMSTAMPPLASLQSERCVQLTDEGRDALRRGLVGGLRRTVLEALSDGRPVSVGRLARVVTERGTSPRSGGAPKGNSLQGPIAGLVRAGFLTIEQPIRGRPSAAHSIRVAQLTPAGLTVTSSSASVDGGRLTDRQQAAIRALAISPEGLSLRALTGQGIAPDTVLRLARRGLVHVWRAHVERDPFSGPHRSVLSDESRVPDLTPSTEQASALDRLVVLARQRRYHAVLLHGVTGSGKTEVYLRTARAVLEEGRGVLVLVPEIGLTPAVAGAFRRAFGDDVAIQHSGLSSGERYDQWQRIRRGTVRIVVGTRSAVFAPLVNLGLVIVDEEHDTSYKQEEAPRYHGRDVGVMRARRADALVVLGSATPAMETYANALRGRYERIVLSKRVLERPLAQVQIVDMRREYADRGPDVVLSQALGAALETCLDRGEQALVLLNRRGYFTSVFCRQCGGTVECPNCSVSLTVHRAARRARCHYCNYATPVPVACPVCGGEYLEQVGIGTERLEAAVRAAVPAARVARLDRDSVRRRGAAVRLLEQVANRSIDVLVGTQMIAKGHDFPAVTLVGVINADVGLGLADFRAGERTFQLLTQVAGRAGRGDRSGIAIVQTLYPEHYSIRYGCLQDYAAFFEEERRFRQAMRYPPEVALVNVVLRAGALSEALEQAGRLVRHLREADGRYRVVGPAPAPLGRLRGEHRAQFFLKGKDRAGMRLAIRAAVAKEPEIARRTIIDVDPLSVL